MPALYLLYETASGYTLFDVKGLDELGASSAQAQQSVNDLARFSKASCAPACFHSLTLAWIIVRVLVSFQRFPSCCTSLCGTLTISPWLAQTVDLVAFKPFKSAIEALEQVNAVAEGIATTDLLDFLEMNLPKVSKHQCATDHFRVRWQRSVLPVCHSSPDKFESVPANLSVILSQAGILVLHRSGVHLGVSQLAISCQLCTLLVASAVTHMSLLQVKKGADPKKAKFQLGVYDSKLGAAIQEGRGFACVCNELSGELLRGVRLHVTHFIKQLEELDVRRSQLGLAHSYSRAKVWQHLQCALS